MRTYEVLFILSPQVTEEEATTLINDFKSIAAANGATLKNEDAWGRRRLAYPIHKFTDGIYHLFVLESDQSLSELDRRMKNVDRVLRHVIVRTDLDQKRADKLAKRNPKKERARPSVPMAGAPAAAPAAAPIVPDVEPSATTADADEAAPQA
jgi:small subunit ribosomal protein S6